MLNETHGPAIAYVIEDRHQICAFTSSSTFAIFLHPTAAHTAACVNAVAALLRYDRLSNTVMVPNKLLAPLDRDTTPRTLSQDLNAVTSLEDHHKLMRFATCSDPAGGDR